MSGILEIVNVRSETKLEKKQEKYWEQVQKLKDDKNLSDKDALELIKVNLANINEYYIWSQKQAKSAFNTAIATCSVGFFIGCCCCFNSYCKTGF